MQFSISPARQNGKLSANEQTQGAEIRVPNSGSGLAAEHLPRVFDRYYRADAGRAASKSTGLGLAIVRAIMHLHGCEVSACNSADGNTVFSLRFPF